MQPLKPGKDITYAIYHDIGLLQHLKSKMISSLISYIDMRYRYNNIHISCLFCSWILYESPGFQGRSIALEEGCLELTNVWASTEPGTDPHGDPDMIIGSIRLAVCVRRLSRACSLALSLSRAFPIHFS